MILWQSEMDWWFNKYEFNNQKIKNMAQTFSQRKGLKPTPELLQVDSMDASLRNCLWNAFDRNLWSHERAQITATRERIRSFGVRLWGDFFKLPVDRVSKSRISDILEYIRKYYFECEWNEVYDFVEFTADYLYQMRYHDTYEQLNAVLSAELSGYRFVNNQLTDITSEQEVSMLEEALSDNQFKGVATHLNRALELYADRENPDYRNSIKESVSAVESMAKIVTGNNKATLTDALKSIERNGQLHKALKDGFEKLYAYTSDANGIRHAMLDDDNLTQADARYFMLSCTSFVNYLKSKIGA